MNIESSEITPNEFDISIKEIYERVARTMYRSADFLGAYSGIIDSIEDNEFDAIFDELSDERIITDLQDFTSEILRWMVVYNHAVLEDTQREIMRLNLKGAQANVLDTIPLVGISKYGQPRKFLLGQLLQFSGNSIDDIISNSIDKYLEKKTFNSVSDIVSALSQFEIDISSLRPYFPRLEELITKRHKIVHDLDSAIIDGDIQLTPITPRKCELWSVNCSLFIIEQLNLLRQSESLTIEGENLNDLKLRWASLMDSD